MAIKEKKNDSGEISYIYDVLNDDNIYDQANVIAEALKDFVQSATDLHFSSDISIDPMLIQEAVVRIDKRRDYFSIFHEETKISEVKRAALWAYWIVKFKFIHVKEEALRGMLPAQKAKLTHINEKFAAYLIFAAVKAESKARNTSFSVHEDYCIKLTYALKYWHLNKNAFMMIAESLCAGMR